MSKKHFKELAEVLHTLASNGTLDAEAHKTTVCAVAAWCETVNVLFNGDRFTQAAGMSTQAGKWISDPNQRHAEAW